MASDPTLPVSAGRAEQPGKSGGPQDPQEAAAFSWGAFLSTYLPALILALGTGIALPAVPALAKSFHVNFALASGVTTAFLLGNVACTIPSGWLIDRFGRRRIMLAGPILTSVMAFAVVFAHSFPELLVYRFLDGCAAQMWLMGRLAGISQGAAANQRGRQVSWMFGMDSLGRISGPLVGGFIAVALGVRALFAAYGVLALIALIPGFMLIKDTPRAARSVNRNSNVPRPSLREIILPRLVYFGVAFFAAGARGPSQSGLLHLYAAYAYHLGPKQIGYLATGASGVSLPIGFAAGWMMDRFGRKKAMVPGFAGVTIAMVALAVSAFLHLSLVWYVSLFLAGTMCQALTGGSIQTVGADVAPPEGRGLFLGIWRFTGQGGVALSPIIFAFMASRISYGSSFLFVATSAAVVAYLLIRYVPETRQPAVVRSASPEPAAAG